ncbi:hypothetical protein [Brevundimonas variabilis]|uniref:Uncharacterized protein n=1 Tax=Brevundimonas variabilis TaxID=74312 RepID=A0A7W9FF80_9CAUL|nr:hypothetical protein [Brevundimonas variabilis]MBB5747040.1 hypothetical protein [Brevundimonas variabilis]
MTFYLRQPSPDTMEELWEIDAHRAINRTISNAEQSGFGYFQADPGEDVWTAIRRNTPWFEPDGANPFHETCLPPGEYHPRIARPLMRARPDMGLWNRSGELNPALTADARTQARTLLRQLERICQTVQPKGANLDAYGHDIRNLLILACTEVEAQWRGILVANGATKSRLTTADYVVLADILKLRDYEVRFPTYPDLEPVSPFEAWGLTGSPSRELPWYEAYNAVKHDREAAFSQATLKNVISALSAGAVMLYAQFGRTGLGHQSDLSAFFHFVQKPSWSLSEVYIWPVTDGENGRSEWTPVSHQRLKAIR